MRFDQEFSSASASTALGVWAILLMLIVSVACGTTAVGLWLLRLWGQRTALIILTVNLIADTARALLFHDYRTLVGVPLAAFMIGYLVKRRGVFTQTPHRLEPSPVWG